MKKTNKTPKNTFVFIIANISSAADNLFVKIWSRSKVTATKITNTLRSNSPVAVKIIKNQNDAPAATTILLNLGEVSSILDRVNECD
jgi:hypothetical protein